MSRISSGSVMSMRVTLLPFRMLTRVTCAGSMGDRSFLAGFQGWVDARTNTPTNSSTAPAATTSVRAGFLIFSIKQRSFP